MKSSLSVILACYNESQHLLESFSRLFTVLQKNKISFEIIFVDDKSKDNTLDQIKQIISSYSESNIKLISHKTNLGRGRAVVDGIKISSGDIVGYIDVDLEIDPKYIPATLELLVSNDVVCAKRKYIFIPYFFHRYFATKWYASLVKKLFKLPVSDTEAGFKFFKRNKILPIIKKTKNPGWFWDTEIMVYSSLEGLKLAELPVVYRRRQDKNSTVNTLPDSIKYFINIINLYWRIHNKLPT